jgi:signal peptidase I
MRRRPITVVAAFILVGALVAGVGIYLLEKNKQSLPAPLQMLAGGRLVRVLGQAMYPALRDNDVVTFDTSAYRDHPPQRGDIVLFAPPNESSRLFVMRVIALPNDRLLISKGVVSINDQVLPEPYLAEAWTYSNSWPADGKAVLVLPNQYFVMGDNRNHSSDSRTFGFVNRGVILGKLLR